LDTPDSATPLIIRGVTGAVGVAAGYGHTCALLRTGQVKCWGLGGAGQLGNPSAFGPAPSIVLEPVTVTGLDDAVGLSAGSFHTCALRANGQVVCWGEGRDGQLGNGADSRAP